MIGIIAGLQSLAPSCRYQASPNFNVQQRKGLHVLTPSTHRVGVSFGEANVLEDQGRPNPSSSHLCPKKGHRQDCTVHAERSTHKYLLICLCFQVANCQ